MSITFTFTLSADRADIRRDHIAYRANEGGSYRVIKRQELNT